MKKQKGFTMVTALLIISLLLVFVPTLIYLIQHEGKLTVHQRKKTTAFHLSEAGQDRGIWKLRESSTIWNNAVSSTPVTGYEDDVEYADISGGVYKIDFQSGPGTGEVTVISKGKASASSDVQAVKGVYSKSSTLGALSVDGAIKYKPNLIVHWGQVVSYTSIDEEPNQYYPRKYSAGMIKGRDEANDSNNGALPSGNWSTYDYAAYQNLGTAPLIKLDDYRDKAKKSCVPLLRASTGSGAATPTNLYGCDSGYYTGQDVKIQKPGGGSATEYIFTCSTCVIFIDGNGTTTGNIVSFPGGAWLNIEALVAIGDLDYNAGSTNYTATIPNKAQDEYQKSTQATNFWTASGWTNGGSYSITSCGMHGFLYVGDDLTNSGGGAKLCGAIYAGDEVSLNTLTLYYDTSVANNVVMSDSPITRKSWDEIKTSW
ncbi:MAG: hypothetical protein LHV69_06710 [Elusimicrobia bacterium]|nr:hypothetical protein [Candidatus Obscuribacterium magneticum]